MKYTRALSSLTNDELAIIERTSEATGITVGLLIEAICRNDLSLLPPDQQRRLDQHIERAYLHVRAKRAFLRMMREPHEIAGDWISGDPRLARTVQQKLQGGTYEDTTTKAQGKEEVEHG